eukprot:262299_1
MSIFCHSCKRIKNKQYENVSICNECMVLFQQHLYYYMDNKDDTIPISSIKKRPPIISNIHKGKIPVYPWKIKAVCVMKEIRPNTVVVVLMDKYGTELKVICNGFDCVFEKKRNYLIHHAGPLIMSNKDYGPSILQKGDYCILLYPPEPFNSKVIRLNDTPSEIDYRIQKCNFITLNKIQSSQEQFVDIRGMITGVCDIRDDQKDECSTKNCLQCDRKYRIIHIQDRTGIATIGLWNNDAYVIELERFATSEFDANCVLIITLRKCHKGTGCDKGHNYENGILSALGTVEIEEICSDRIDLDEVLDEFAITKGSIFYYELYNRKNGKKCKSCNRMDVRLKVCKRCRWAYYCSKHCQKKSWNTKHKYYCLSLVRI